MKRKFVICIDNATKDQQDKVTNFFKEINTLGYWHWFSDVWLVTDPNKEWTSESLRDQLNTLLLEAHTLVIQIDGTNTWNGFGHPKAFEWFNDAWND